MNLLIVLGTVAAVTCLLRFLLALQRDERASTGREITVYVMEQGRPLVRQISARRYGQFTVMDGGGTRGNTVRGWNAATTRANLREQPVKAHRGALRG